jgi:shikimate dehydrogenase
MDRYAVIGHPVAHSRSPRIHSLFAQQVGACLTYEAVEISPDRLAVMLRRLYEESYLGLNVTLPHKTAVAALCEQVSERAALAGAVNTLLRTPTGWRGDNTDGEGLVRDLARLGCEIEDRRALVLGAGGAARGILGPLLALQPRELVLSNRTPWKPEEVVKSFTARGPIRPSTHLALKGDRFDLIINATSAGHSGQMPRLPPNLFAKDAYAYDLSYGQASEPFLKWASAQGVTRCVDGLGMLVEQAAAAFELWRGVRPQTEQVLRELRK